MNDERIDRALEHLPGELPPALAARIRARIQSDTQPVQPMRSAGTYTLILAAIFGLVGILFAAVITFKGIHALSALQSAAFFSILAVLGWMGATFTARSMRPASGYLPSWLFSGIALVAYEILVLTLFRDYSTQLFVHYGLACLSLGLLCGALVSVPVWLVLRRGFVVEPVRAGALAGLLCGLTGLFALTLHCPVLTTPHAGIWHAAVMPICVAAGALIGRLRR